MSRLSEFLKKVGVEVFFASSLGQLIVSILAGLVTTGWSLTKLHGPESLVLGLVAAAAAMTFLNQLDALRTAREYRAADKTTLRELRRLHKEGSELIEYLKRLSPWDPEWDSGTRAHALGSQLGGWIKRVEDRLARVSSAKKLEFSLPIAPIGELEEEGRIGFIRKQHEVLGRMIRELELASSWFP